MPAVSPDLSAPRRSRIFPALAWTAAVLLVVNFAIYVVGITTGVGRFEVCLTCGSCRETRLLGLGTDGEHGLYRRTETFTGSRALDEVYGGTHAHTWGLAHEEHYVGLVKRLQVCGNPLPNPMALAYGRDDGVRASVASRLADGRLRREDLVAYMEIPDFRHRSSPPGSSTPAYHERIRRALALATECGAEVEFGFAFAGWKDAIK